MVWVSVRCNRAREEKKLLSAEEERSRAISEHETSESDATVWNEGECEGELENLADQEKALAFSPLVQT